MNCNHIDPQPLLLCLLTKSFPGALGPPPLALFHFHRGTSGRERQSEARGGGRRRPEVNFCGRTSEYPDGWQASRGQILLPALLTLSKLTLLVLLGYFGAKAMVYNVKKKKKDFTGEDVKVKGEVGLTAKVLQLNFL